MSKYTKNTNKHSINYSTYENVSTLLQDTYRNFTLPLNVPLIDSLTIRIPIEYCDILDETLTSPTRIYYEQINAVTHKLYPSKPVIREINGIKIRLTVSEQPYYNRSTKKTTQKRFIYTVLTTKLLKQYYFYGINKVTIPYLFDNLMSLEIFTCDYSHFLESLVSDIDICINTKLDNWLYKDFLHELQIRTGTKRKYTELTYQPKLAMLRLNKRTTASPSLPFCKSYDKEKELLNKSFDFWNTFLFDNYGTQIKSLKRFECTIKNYEHRKRLEKYNITRPFKTLRELLQLSEKELFSVCHFSINSYIEPTKRRLKAPHLSPNDALLFSLIQDAIINGRDIDFIYNMRYDWEGTSPETTKVGRSRTKSKIKKLHSYLFEKDLKIRSKAQQNKHIYEYLTFLGIKI